MRHRSCLRLVLACTLWLAADRAWGAVAFVQNVGSAKNDNSSSNTSLTLHNVPATTTGDSLIVSVAIGTGAGAVTVSDSAGNAYANDADVTNNSGVRTIIFSAHNTTALAAGGLVTVTWTTGLTTRQVMTVLEVFGLAPANATDRSTASSGSGLSPSAGSTGTTTHDNEVVVATFGHVGAAETFSLGSGFVGSTSIQTTTGSGTHHGLDTEYRTLSSAASVTCAGGFSTSRYWAAACMTYMDVADRYWVQG